MTKTFDEVQAERKERERDRSDRDRDRERGGNRARRYDSNIHQTVNPATGDAFVTVFGDSGGAPFTRAEGHGHRLALLGREDITRENWMMRVAENVRGMNAELQENRRDRLVAMSTAAAEDTSEDESDDQDSEDEPDAVEELRRRDAGEPPLVVPPKPVKVKRPAVGIYEPHTNMTHCSSATQPTSARLERVSPQRGRGADGLLKCAPLAGLEAAAVGRRGKSTGAGRLESGTECVGPVLGRHERRITCSAAISPASDPTACRRGDLESVCYRRRSRPICEALV